MGHSILSLRPSQPLFAAVEFPGHSGSLSLSGHLGFGRVLPEPPRPTEACPPAGLPQRGSPGAPGPARSPQCHASTARGSACTFCFVRGAGFRNAAPSRLQLFSSRSRGGGGGGGGSPQRQRPHRPTAAQEGSGRYRHLLLRRLYLLASPASPAASASSRNAGAAKRGARPDRHDRAPDWPRRATSRGGPGRQLRARARACADRAR